MAQGDTQAPGTTATADRAATPVVPGSEPLAAVPSGTTVETLLKPDPNDKDPNFAHFGSLAVERSHLAEFEQAQRYLSKDPEAVSALYDLEHAKDTHTLKFIEDGNDRYNHNTNTIYWDPKSALQNTNGSTQTAALGLLHEQGHALEHQRDPQEYFAGIRDAKPAYQNREEERVITGIETRAAKILGEGTRQDHGGTPFNAKDSISRTPEAPTHRAEVDLAPQIDKQIAASRALGSDAPPGVAKGAGAVEPWDGKPHSGSFVHLGPDMAAQHVGGGNYQVYDVDKQLGGVMPPQSVRDVSVDREGNVNVPHADERSNAR